MPYEYSAEHHDWDMTLKASHELLMLGQCLQLIPKNTLSGKIFSCWTGSMLLSFCSIESFSASVAFSMPDNDKFKNFDFEKYKRTPRFWEKLALLCEVMDIQIDKSHGTFQKIAEMQRWRNLVTHASPYEIPATNIVDTIKVPRLQTHNQ